MNPKTDSNIDPDELAEQVLTVSDWRTMDAEGLTASECLERKLGVDASECDDVDELHAAVLSARKQNGDPDNKAGETEVFTGVGDDTREFGDSETEIEALSESVMTVSEWREADRTAASSAEFIHRKFGVDPREYRTEAGLRQAIDQGGEK